MKVHMHPQRRPLRGHPVEVGNVYVGKGSRHYHIVVSVIPRVKDKWNNEGPWNNVISLHVNALGEIVGASKDPEGYVSDHRDLIGKALDLPDFTVQWLEDGEVKEAPKRRK